MTLSKLMVDFYAPEEREKALAASFMSLEDRSVAEVQIEGAEVCSGCGAHGAALQARASWREAGNMAVLVSLAGYCQDCVSVLDLKSEDLLSPARANAAVAWLAAVNEWSFLQASEYLMAEGARAKNLLALGVQMTYDTEAVRAAWGQEVDLLGGPALDSGEHWATNGPNEPASIGGEVEEEIGAVETLAAVAEAQSEKSAPAISAFIPETAALPVESAAVSEVAGEEKVAEVKSLVEPAVEQVAAKLTGKTKAEEALGLASANYYAEMTGKVQVRQKAQAKAAWEEAHKSTAMMKDVLLTRYDGLKLPGTHARSKVRVVKFENQPDALIVELEREKWRLRVINNFPGHKNIWVLQSLANSGKDRKWIGVSFDSEVQMMTYFAQNVSAELAEAPRVPAEVAEEVSI